MELDPIERWPLSLAENWPHEAVRYPWNARGDRSLHANWPWFACAEANERMFVLLSWHAWLLSLPE